MRGQEAPEDADRGLEEGHVHVQRKRILAVRFLYQGHFFKGAKGSTAQKYGGKERVKGEVWLQFLPIKKCRTWLLKIYN